MQELSKRLTVRSDVCLLGVILESITFEACMARCSAHKQDRLRHNAASGELLFFSTYVKLSIIRIDDA